MMVGQFSGAGGRLPIRPRYGRVHDQLRSFIHAHRTHRAHRTAAGCWAHPRSARERVPARSLGASNAPMHARRACTRGALPLSSVPPTATTPPRTTPPPHLHITTTSEARSSARLVAPRGLVVLRLRRRSDSPEGGRRRREAVVGRHTRGPSSCHRHAQRRPVCPWLSLPSGGRRGYSGRSDALASGRLSRGEERGFRASSRRVWGVAAARLLLWAAAAATTRSARPPPRPPRRAPPGSQRRSSPPR